MMVLAKEINLPMYQKMRRIVKEEEIEKVNLINSIIMMKEC